MGRRRNRNAGPHGLLVVDKPAGVTSHDVVDLARRRLGQRRIGHSGTLDPPATGVLLLGVGQVTRALRWLTALPKTYTGEVVLGATTSTLDDTGEVVERFDMGSIDPDEARALVAAELTGPIEQIPPMVSAVRVDGRRLHEVARAGEEVEREPRSVVVHRFEVGEPVEPGVLPIEVECSSGTYVRTLADDLGRLLGGGAHLRRLRRTAIGSFGVEEAAPVDDAELLTPVEAVRDLARVDVDADTADRVRHGSVLDLGLAGEVTAAAVVGPDAELLAVYEPHRGAWKPAAVLATTT
ncbi:MAG: tRNA pseudouridine(55) synthase TruB [Actinomycetota bacterium]